MIFHAFAAVGEASTTVEQALPWLSIVGAILTIASFAAAAAAFFRATAGKATIELQGRLIETLKEEVRQVRELSERLSTLNVSLTAENTVLNKALSGKADIERVETLIDTHHRQVMEDRNLDRVSHEARFDKLDDTLKSILGILHDRRAA